MLDLKKVDRRFLIGRPYSNTLDALERSADSHQAPGTPVQPCYDNVDDPCKAKKKFDQLLSSVHILSQSTINIEMVAQHFLRTSHGAGIV